MLSVAIVIFAIFVLVDLHNLRSRLAKLEQRPTSQPTAYTAPAASSSGSTPSSSPTTPPRYDAGFTAPAPAPQSSKVTSPSSNSFDLFEWLKRDWLLKLGGLLVLLALGWLVSYAFIHNWIGPVARVVLGLSLGTILLVIGWERMHTHFHQGSIFLVLGSSAVIITLYAARLVYGFFTPLSALSIMFLSAVVVAGASVRYRSQSLAYLGLILATIAPSLVTSPKEDHLLLFTYLLVVMLGTVWLLFQNRVFGLPLLALAIVAFYSSPYLFTSHLLELQAGVILWIAFCLIFLLFLMNIVIAIKDLTFPVPLQIIFVGGNTILLITWILAVVPKSSQSLFLLLWMGGLVLLSLILRSLTSRSGILLSHSLAIVALLATATAVEFDGPVLTLAYIIESLFLPLITWLLSRDIRQSAALSFFVVLPITLSIPSVYSAAWQTGIWHGDFFVLLLLAISLLTLGFFFRLKSLAPTTGVYQIASLYLVTGSVVAYTLLWLSLHALLVSDNLATLLSYAVYTIIGIAFYLQGRAIGRKGWKQYGSALVLLVVARLLLVDVWNLELSGRIMTFFLVGILLMSTAFLDRKQVNSSQ